MNNIFIKFSFEKDFKPLSFDGLFLTTNELKDKVMNQKNLFQMKQGQKKLLFDLEFYHQDKPNEKLEDDKLIPKNSSIIIKRIPLQQTVPKPSSIQKENTNPLPLKSSEFVTNSIKCDSCLNTIQPKMVISCCNHNFCNQCLRDGQVSCKTCLKNVSKDKEEDNVLVTKKFKNESKSSLKKEETKVEPLSNESFWMLLTN